MSYLTALHRSHFGLRLAAWILLSILMIYFWWGIQKFHLGRIEKEYLPAIEPSWFFISYFGIPALFNSGTAFLLGLIGKQQRLERSIGILALAIVSPFVFTFLLLTAGCFVAVVIFHISGACL
jgi:hypothetical protein